MKNESSIAIIGAMDCEVDCLKSLLQDKNKVEYGKLSIYTGTIEGHSVVLAKSGVGKVNAALNTQYIIDNFHPGFIINTGIAGGVADGLSVGDIIIGKELIQYDFDTSALGYARGYMCTGVNSDKPTVYYSDENLIKLFEKAVKKSHPEIHIHKGIIATGDTFISSGAKKQEIKDIFNASAVEMEGCAIAQTAAANSVKVLVIRALSDLADGSATKSLDIFEKQMAEFSASTIHTLLKMSELYDIVCPIK